MGCRLSGCLSVKTAIGESFLEDELGLTTQEIRQLHDFFNKYDPFGSGKLLIYNFVSSSRIDFSVFFRRVLGLFDIDECGKLSFNEFVCSLWAFLTHSPDAMNVYLFDLYDETKSDELNVTEIKHMMRDLHRKNYDRHDDISAAIDKLGDKKKRDISRADFLQWSAVNPHLLIPAHNLQERMRYMLIGDVFWARIQTRRCATCPSEMSNAAKYDRIRALLRMSSFHEMVCTRLASSDKLLSQRSPSTRGGHTPIGTSPRYRGTTLNHPVPKTPLASPGGNLSIESDPPMGDDDLAEYPSAQDMLPRIKPSGSFHRSKSSSLLDECRSIASSMLSRQGSKVYSVTDISLDEVSSPSQRLTPAGRASNDTEVPSVLKLSPSIEGFDFLEAVRKKLEGPDTCVDQQLPCISSQCGGVSRRQSVICSEGGEEVWADGYLSDVSDTSTKRTPWREGRWASEEKEVEDRLRQMMTESKRHESTMETN